MDIQQIIDRHSGIVSMLFQVYGINQPVNYDTLSAAITIYSSDNGNAFLTDLLSAIDGTANDYDDYDDYDELFGLGAKGKARRAEKREARGGYSRIGALVRKVGIAKNRPAQASKMNKEAALNIPAPNAVAESAQQNQSQDGQTQSKITVDQVLDGVQKGAGVLGGVIDAIKGGGGESGGSGGGGGYEESGGDDGAKKWYQKPLVLVAIAGGVLVVVVVAVFAFKGKK